MKIINNIIIRKFKKSDARQCVALIEVNKENMGDLYTPDSLISASLSNQYWVAETTERIVGMIGFSDLHNGIGMLLTLSVLPQMQRMGIGRALIETAKKYAKKNHFRKILLLTHAKNKPMMLLAIQQDFIPEGSLKNHFRTGDDVIYLSYFLE
ncbi:GNAT family N-acetyltransferase [Candidatus Gottesmanbacteria bacterium]|nr:GNAT family N-acetyltransferase [Candidatus Gottesmanbacteria bacterium]